MRIKLGEICKFQSGGTPSKGNMEYFNGNIPWITTTALNGGNIDESNAVDWITDKAIKESAAKIVPAHSIMVGTRVGVGKVAVNTVDMSTSQDIISLIDIDEQLWNKDFLCKFIQGKSQYLNSQARGATIKGIKIEVLAALELPDVSLAEQLCISKIIDSVKQLIFSRQLQLQKLDELIKARFVEMFDSVTEEQLLGDISELVSVGIANSATHAYAESGIPMLRNQNIKENFLDDSDLIYIKPEFAALYETKKLKENDIIAMRTGYPGVACLVPKKYEGCQTFTTLIVRLKEGYNPSYVCSYINSDLGKRFIDSEKVGVAQQNLGAKSLAKMPVKIAPKQLQDDYAAFVNQINKSKVAVQEALDEAQLLFDSLMQKYFG